MLTKLLSYLPGFSAERAPYRRFTRHCYTAGLLSLACLFTATCPVKTTELAATGHSQKCGAGLHTQTHACGADFCAIPYPDLKRGAAALTPQAIAQAPQFPLSQTFKLHSRPTATKTIYLDFDGHSTTGTPWNSGGNTITTSVYSFEGDDSFSNNELTQVQEIWQRVSECYSPFDLDVTTEQPPVADLINSGSGDTRWGVRVCIGNTSPSPAPGAGGVAFIGSFSWDTDTPAFVFIVGSGIVGKYVADATVHEVGHTLGLIHDGRISPKEEYYQGHGTGLTAWAPNMGVGYYVNLVQWSEGEYLSANNQEDDLNIITTKNGFGYRADDYASNQQSASKIGGSRGATAFNVDQSGIIEKRADTDWFKIVAKAGTLDLIAVGGPSNTMLDMQMDLYSDKGALIVSNNPPTDLKASIRRTVAAGTYFLKIDGVGLGDVSGTGYSDYSSLGQYRITGTFLDDSGSQNASKVTASYNPGTKQLTITGDTGNNSVSIVRSGLNLKVEGGTATTINNKTSEVFVLSAGTTVISLIADLKEGADILSIDGVGLLNATINMGAGADNLTIKNSPSAVMVINADSSAANVAGADSVVLQSSNVSNSLICDLGPFNDTFSVSASTIKSLNLQMGAGDDTATLAYSSFTTLTVDGGAGVDTLVRTTSTVTNTPTITGVP